MSDFIQDLSEVIPPHLRKRVQEELLRGWRMEEVKAQSSAKQAAVYNHANEAHSIEGIGQLKARIPLAAGTTGVSGWGTSAGKTSSS